MAAKPLCSIPGCDKPAFCRGWCRNHYALWYRNGRPETVKPSSGEPWEFYRETVLTFEGDECLMWPYNRTVFGHARIFRDRRAFYVHRLACETVHGAPVGDRNHVAHNCGNGHLGCVNPRHLRWVTRAENNADKAIHGSNLRGASNPNARLTEDDVREIRSLIGKKTKIDIAAQFDVSNQLISEIANGNAWGWLLPESG